METECQLKDQLTDPELSETGSQKNETLETVVEKHGLQKETASSSEALQQHSEHFPLNRIELLQQQTETDSQEYDRTLQQDNVYFNAHKTDNQQLERNSTPFDNYSWGQQNHKQHQNKAAEDGTSETYFRHNEVEVCQTSTSTEPERQNVEPKEQNQLQEREELVEYYEHIRQQEENEVIRFWTHKLETAGYNQNFRHIEDSEIFRYWKQRREVEQKSLLQMEPQELQCQPGHHSYSKQYIQERSVEGLGQMSAQYDHDQSLSSSSEPPETVSVLERAGRIKSASQDGRESLDEAKGRNTGLDAELSQRNTDLDSELSHKSDRGIEGSCYDTSVNKTTETGDKVLLNKSEHLKTSHLDSIQTETLQNSSYAADIIKHFIPVEVPALVQANGPFEESEQDIELSAVGAETSKTESHNEDKHLVQQPVGTNRRAKSTSDKKKSGNLGIHFKCLCVNDFLSNKKPEKYSCGLCHKRFATLCHLHEHIEKHGAGGSYHFDHMSYTAYPKYDTFCSFTQTDDDFFVRTEETVVNDKNSKSGFIFQEVLSSDMPVSEDKRPVENSVNSLESASKTKTHRRKQNNPKPSKRRLSGAENEKTSGNKKVRKRDSTTSKQGSKPDIETEKYHTEIVIISENEKDEKPPFENAYVEIKQEVIAHDEFTNTVLPRKRGRPKKHEKSQKSPYVKKKKLSAHTQKLLKKDLGESQDAEADGLTEMGNDITGMSEDMKNELKRKKIRKNAAVHQICEVCGITVPGYNYAYHLRQHTGEKPFICDQCGKAFAHKRFLTKHLVTHSDDKPWKCEVCTAQFCQKNEYDMHMNGHKGVRPFECRVCDMKFFSKSMLNTHQANIHMGITRFECQVCSRRFFKRSSLVVHEATHYDATMKCSYCDRKFRDKTGLKRHERIHTGEKKFRCHICDHAFIQSTPYWVHMERRHSLDRDTVKKMLQEVRENNKRCGKKTEINVLPADINLDSSLDSASGSKSSKRDCKQKALKKALKLSQNCVTGNSVPAQDGTDTTSGKRHFYDIKVPTVYPLDSAERSVEQTYSPMSETSDAVQTLAPYRLDEHTPQRSVTPYAASCSQSQQQDKVTSESLLVSHGGNPTSSLGLSQFGIPLNLMQQHGFIGLNTLQQAVDYTSSVPSSGTYTELSGEHH